MAESKRAASERFFRGIGMFSAILTVVVAFALITFLVLDASGLNALEADEPRTYIAQFMSEEETISYKYYRRGEKLEKPANPKHSESEYYRYTFGGWDITGDGKADILPARVYFDFRAEAVYFEKQIKPIPKSSNPLSSSSESLSGEIYG